MNKKILSFSLIFVFLLGSIPLSFVPGVFADGAAEGHNVLTNHSFENGLTGWNPVNNGYDYTVKTSGGSDGDKWISSDPNLITGSVNNISQSFDPPIHALEVNAFEVDVYWKTDAQYPYCKATLGISFVAGEGNDDYQEWNLGLTLGYPHDGWDVLDGYGNISTFQNDKHIDEIWLKLSFGDYGSTEVGFDNFHLDVEGAITVEADLELFNDVNNGDPGFVFVDWKYYDFNVTVLDSLFVDPLDFVFMRFNLPTYEGVIVMAPYYDSGADVWGLITSSSDLDRAGESILIMDGYTSDVTDATSFHFRIWFEDKCVDVWDPDDCVDVEAAFNTTAGDSSGWVLHENVFRVYNDGGFPDDVTITGNAGVLPGGRDLSMFAYNDSYASKELVWRDAVHIKLMPEVHFRAGEGAWQQYFSMDYMLADGSQKQGLQLLIEPSFVSYTGVFASNVWINMTCKWYDTNGLIKQDILYMFYHGSVSNKPDPGRYSFFVDFWFDVANGSTVQGGRINAYEFPVQDSSDAWLRWLSSNWGVKDDVYKQSECFTSIYELDNATAIQSERIKFVVFSSSLYVFGIEDSDQFVGIPDYNVYSVTQAQQLPMKGISSPPWDETQMPTVGNAGVLGAMFSMLSGIGAWLSENVLFGGLNMWETFVNFLDTIAGWLGAPGFFTDLFGWISNGLTYLADSLSYGFGIISNIFLMIGAVIVDFLVIISEAIVSFVATLGMVGDMLGGGISGASNVWNDLGLSTWITVVLIFYPLYLILLWEREGAEPVIQQLTWIFGILVWLGGFFISIAQFVIGLITALIESIPVAE